jgi:hypothetical protein
MCDGQVHTLMADTCAGGAHPTLPTPPAESCHQQTAAQPGACWGATVPQRTHQYSPQLFHWISNSFLSTQQAKDRRCIGAYTGRGSIHVCAHLGHNTALLLPTCHQQARARVHVYGPTNCKHAHRARHMPPAGTLHGTVAGAWMSSTPRHHACFQCPCRQHRLCCSAPNAQLATPSLLITRGVHI